MSTPGRPLPPTLQTGSLTPRRSSVSGYLRTPSAGLAHRRWDDRYAEILVEKTPELADRFGPPQQIWAAESLAKQWGLPIGQMGRRDTGTEMDDESADALRLPEKAVVVDYARRGFARLQAAIDALPVGQELHGPPGRSRQRHLRP